MSGTKVLIRELSSAVPGSFHSRAATGTATASCVLSVNSPWQAKYVIIIPHISGIIILYPVL